jgi:hypothetical protein
LHLADHPAAAAVDAVTVAVKAAVVAAVLAFEALAAIVTFGAVEALEALWTFEAFGPFGAFLHSLGLAIRTALGAAIEALSAIVSPVVSAFDALEPFRTVVANDALVTLRAFESFGAVTAVYAIRALRAVHAIRALRAVDSIGAISSVGSLDAWRPFGSLESFVALRPFGEFASLRRRFNSVRPFAAIVAIVDLIDASGVDSHGCVVGIGGGYCASAAAGAWTHAARRLRV